MSVPMDYAELELRAFARYRYQVEVKCTRLWDATPRWRSLPGYHALKTAKMIAQVLLVTGRVVTRTHDYKKLVLPQRKLDATHNPL